jgi:cytochrome c oxidase subunit I+III
MSRVAAYPPEAPAFPVFTKPLGWWGMVFFILTEAILFSFLIASYFYLRSTNDHWPPSGISDPEIPIALINTVILLASSVPMFLGSRAASRGSRGGVVAGLVVAALLGIAFLAIQCYELANLDFGYNDNSYASSFITLTGFHMAHLIAGVLIVAFMVIRAIAGHFTPEHHVGIEVTALYWHFVDVVWIAVFLTLHISPRLL